MSGTNCIDKILISAYLDGELDQEAISRVETHLAACQDCCARYEGMKADRNLLLESLPGAEPPAHLKAHLFRRINSEPEESRTPGWGWTGINQVLSLRHKPWAFAGASIVLFLVVLSAFHLQHRIEDGKLLAEIDRSRAEWVAREKAGNPFHTQLKRAVWQLSPENPFKAFLNER